MRRILFVCTGNTCRSVMAQYIANRRFQDFIEATSAGVQPGSIGDTDNAVFTLRKFGIDASGHKPRAVGDINVSEFDLIVTMDNHVARQLKQLVCALPADRLIKWQIKDPYGDDLEEYDRCAQAIHRELKNLTSKVEGA